MGGLVPAGKIDGLGPGDGTMRLMAGAFLDRPRTILILDLASIVGTVIGLIYLKFRGKDMKFTLSLGTLLAPAADVALVFGIRRRRFEK